MAAPNLIGLTTVTLKTAILDPVTTSETDLIAAIATGYAANVEVVFVSNNHASLASYIYLALRRSGVSTLIGRRQRVSTGQTLNVLLGKPLYLEEGDALRIYAEDNSVFAALAPYTLVT